MQVVNVTLDRRKARDLYRAYKSHKAYERPEDYQIMRAYQLIAQGRTIIQALQSIKEAGLQSNRLPKLAITRANAMWCHLTIDQRGDGQYSGKGWRNPNNKRDVIRFQRGFFPIDQHATCSSWESFTALVPIIPIHLRPKRGLENYHILWEAVWEKSPPVDPYLLRRIDNSDFWMVMAAWDLTEVEQAALKTRMLIV